MAAMAACGGFALCFSSCETQPALAGPRPSQWAKPLKVAGAPNLYQIGPNLYRSAQPTAEGMKNLQAMGIKTVVSLRRFHSDDGLAAGLPLHRVSLPTLTWDPDPKNAEAFLKLASDPANGPILIHCQHGADRTGAMCAIYRVRAQHWKPEEALREMTGGGYGYHPLWKNLPGWAQLQMKTR